jgi:hypothetical protein
MAVAHGETRRRAPALTIGASVVPMIDAARAAEHADAGARPVHPILGHVTTSDLSPLSGGKADLP